MSATITRTDLSVRRATRDDTDRILELVKLSLGEGVIPRSREYWNWKHHRNPFGDSPMLIAEDGDLLVGLRVFMRWEWAGGGKQFKAVRAVDTATHPDYRGKGIFSKLTRRLVDEMRDEGVHFIFNTPNGQSMPGYLKMGWKSVGKTDLMIRPLKPMKVVSALRRGGIRDADADTDSGDNGMDAFASAEAFFDSPDATKILSLVVNGSQDFRLRTPISAPYLRWRYAEIPGFDYHAAWGLDGGDAAVVFFRMKSQGALEELRIADLLVGRTSGSKRIARNLLRGLAAGTNADYVSAMAAPHLPGRMALIRSGFIPAPRLGPILTVRLLNDDPGLTDPYRRSSWRLTTGGMELF
jgi:GNAT superfamily N-acetyltransferase